MKNIGILYDKNVTLSGAKPFKKDNQYNKDYQAFLMSGKKHGLNYFLAPYTQYQNHAFKQAWFFSGRWQKIKNQKLDAVFEKIDGGVSMQLKKKIFQELPLVNDYFFDLLCTDKWLTYKKWPQFFPASALGSDAGKIRKFNTDLVVAKPRNGASGKGIKFIKRKKYKKISDLYIVQEFIQGGKIFNHHGQHDFRVYLVNEKIILTSLRLPIKHKYLANVGQGGKEILFANKRIPKVIMPILKKISNDLKKIKPKVYSIDFMINSTGQAYLVELNSRPGLTHYFNNKIRDNIHNNISKALQTYV